MLVPGVNEPETAVRNRPLFRINKGLWNHSVLKIHLRKFYVYLNFDFNNPIFRNVSHRYTGKIKEGKTIL